MAGLAQVPGLHHLPQLIHGPLDTERRSRVAPLQVLLGPAARALDVETQKVRGIIGRPRDLAALPRGFLIVVSDNHCRRGRSAYGLFERGTFQALVAKNGRGALPLDVRVELRQLVINHFIRAFLPVVFCRRATQAPQHLGVIEPFFVQCVIAMLDPIPRRQGAHHRTVTNHRFDVPLHHAVSVAIGWAPDDDVAFLVLDLVAHVGHQHFGVANPRRFQHVDFTDQVVAHCVENRDLKRRCRPIAFLIGRLGRQIEMLIGPFNRCARRLFVETGESLADTLNQRPHPRYRRTHPATPVKDQPGRPHRYASRRLRAGSPQGDAPRCRDTCA
ncbi:hypothetical protein D3C81_902670 [compost metagenome]